MRILLAGAWRWPWYEEACARGLRELGHEVFRFSWTGGLGWIGMRILLGPQFQTLNQKLIGMVAEIHPDVLFVYRGTCITAETLREVREKSPATIIAQYCNDDLFAPSARWREWRHLWGALTEYDVHFAYRKKNIDELSRRSAKPVHLLLPYFVPWLHAPVAQPKPSCDAVFVGHYEADGRLEALAHARAQGVSVNIYGPNWPQIAHSFGVGGTISPALGPDYCEAITSGKIALCFLSRINSDLYTRRNFEIPAIGSFMLSERSDELLQHFKPGLEAEYFTGEDELVSKSKFYSAHDTARAAIAAKGRERVLQSGHDVTSRMKEMLVKLKPLLCRT